ncbi:DUF2490 domain-containing protein [Mucilaginibacter sp. JRF]|uniref:DUF2490 domain-containing protein n=1 Tax=Mucilaginibacter sp. JRF TaxID=2780088 RepID=UPI00187F9C16|nr:DUF2490 domain-containing protein [Mucilaginibacter sp. JRF]MBE9584251.1 DUF2490 domain-containing protein [Mucilaginibacter sp. JRF]
MNVIIRLQMLILLIGSTTVAYGQENYAGWFFLTNTHKLTHKFDLLTDVQLRNKDKIGHLNTLLLRGALSYNFNEKHSAALGYAYKGDWEEEVDVKSFGKEHRIYEQYLFKTNIGITELNARFRLEQRFVTEEGSTDFSQRARAFISAQVPLCGVNGFTHGLYAGLQNELFFNIANKRTVNNSNFDQNRSFVSLGYRFNKMIDAEFGYLYWYQKEIEDNTTTNVWQLVLTTQF